MAPFSLPEFHTVAGVEASLWSLADVKELGLSDAQLDQLTDALARLAEQEAAGPAEHPLLTRCRADYAQLRTWAARGRRSRAQRALATLLTNALK